MTYIILAGGPIENIPPLNEVEKVYDEVVWVGVDRGLLYLIENDIVPVRAFGDFDSITNEEMDLVHRQSVHLACFPKEKDASDLELALDWVINQKPEKIVILGGTGGRLDHMLINVQFLQRGLSHQMDIVMEDSWNRLLVKNPGDFSIEKTAFSYVSFLPVTLTVSNLTLTGFRYPLINTTLKQGSSLSISNELIGETGSYSFSDGILLVIESKDKPIK
ncbi:thiamine diphosphokinase [Evansella tamaricis]|uniref:Thiamine diphosphokinase n=1 Tax=Evansella tamaricis TaxID=2069301 RepID=A0ABS6JFK5_9BACI|nr:thiamine diphosphokinase [Evansella tamaricis]MBU9712471.1 thiamine diphosphokinase [Evansella tamaricis]